MTLCQLEMQESTEETSLRYEKCVCLCIEVREFGSGVQESVYTANLAISITPNTPQTSVRSHCVSICNIVVRMSGLITECFRTIFELIGKALGHTSTELCFTELAILIKISVESVKIVIGRLLSFPNGCLREGR